MGAKNKRLEFSEFVTILKWIAKKCGVEVVFIDRYEPTSKVFSHCGTIQDMPLSHRAYDCNCCDLVLDRDHNASINIKRIGASIQLPEVCQTGTCACIAVDGRGPRL